jgi:hypothetical protein
MAMRELEIARILACGLTDKEIGDQLGSRGLDRAHAHQRIFFKASA